MDHLMKTVVRKFRSFYDQNDYACIQVDEFTITNTPKLIKIQKKIDKPSRKIKTNGKVIKSVFL